MDEGQRRARSINSSLGSTEIVGAHAQSPLNAPTAPTRHGVRSVVRFVDFLYSCIVSDRISSD